MCRAAFTVSALVVLLASGLAAVAPQPATGATVTKTHHYFTLVQYPGTEASDYGFKSFYAQINKAKKTIDMEMYELADTTAEHDLAAAAKRGVRVRVLLDKDFSGGSVNKAAYSYLHGHGVEVKWAPKGYIFHIKSTTFDKKTSDVSTANLTSKYYSTTRDATIVDTDPTQVKGIEKTFAKDFSAGASGKPKSNTVQAAGLVWSPNSGSGTAEAALVNQIKKAKKRVWFTSEELSDTSVIQALAAAAKRGVSCEIVMTNSSDWKSGFTTVTKAGCIVHVFPDSAKALYIHEKIVLDDEGTSTQALFIGSQNASSYSLTRNRELGLILTNAEASAAIESVAKTFHADFTTAPSWKSSGGASTTKTSGACTPTTTSGNCYEAGELCSAAEHGESGLAGNGEAIECEQNGSSWRWEPKA